MKCFKIIAVMLLGVVLVPVGAYSQSPLTADSRIRTFVFNENEVFKLVTEFGYQSNIELATDEDVVTMSVGDAVSFKVTPSGNRLFVKALRNSSHTNMTLVTTKRTYQFELSSVVESGRDIIYVMRFYYPSPVDNLIVKSSVGMASQVPKKDVRIRQVSADDILGGIAPRRMSGGSDVAPSGGKNMNYSMSGDKSLAPTTLYDDGKSTYLKFNSAMQFTPTVYVVSADGTESSVPVRNEGEYIVLTGVYPKLALRSGPAVTCIFNGKMTPLTVAAR
jgi:type IV secretion system protein VirB9